MPKNYNTQKQNNSIEVTLAFPADITEELRTEIMDVINTTKFNKISFPLSSYRHSHDDSIPADDTRVITVGYIKKFDRKNSVFHVVLFNNVKSLIEEFDNPIIKVDFTQYNGKLGTITKLIIIPTCIDNESDTDEVASVEK